MNRDLILVGIRTRGVPLAQKLAEKIKEIEGIEVEVGKLDITLYRDDLTTLADQPIVHGTELPFNIVGKKIVLVDDVLYTGRTVRAALDALVDLGRPNVIQLAVPLIGDIESLLLGQILLENIPTSRKEVIMVKLAEVDGIDKVILGEIKCNFFKNKKQIRRLKITSNS